MYLTHEPLKGASVGLGFATSPVKEDLRVTLVWEINAVHSDNHMKYIYCGQNSELFILERVVRLF
jgi:hypothetical protein